MRGMYNTIYVMLAVFFLAGCGEIPVYEKVYTFEKLEWKQNVKPSFSVKIDDVTKFYDFTITLRTTTDYEFSNLWIYLNSVTPDRKKSREPFEFKITHPDGAWIGKNTGSIVEHQLCFKRRKLPVKGKYTFIIEQGITQSKVSQVLDISLVVERSKASE
jgi:gliding motility-associated lipoprotein GldH